MKRTEPVILSSSFWKLLQERSAESRVIRILHKALHRLRFDREGRIKKRDENYLLDHPCAHYLEGNGVLFRAPSRIVAEKLIGDHFTFREKKGMISYMPRGKEQEINDGVWSLKGRQATSPGKWMRSMFSDAAIKRLKIKDNEFADLSTAVKHEELAADISFKEVGFHEAYDPNNYQTVFDSCMWGHDVGPFYRQFGATCVVCVDGNGQFRARAVVWHNVKDETNDERIVFMDRIYFDSPEVLSGMIGYAKSQGWHHKSAQRRGSSNYVDPEGCSHSLGLSVKTTGGGCEVDFYPYLDTFQKGDWNSVNNYGDGEYDYSSTDGSRGEESEEDNHDGEAEDLDGNWWSEDEVYEVSGDYYHQDDRRICWCHSEEGYRLRSECSKVNGDWYPDDSDEIVYSDPERRYILMEDATEVDGEWHSTDSERIVWSRSESEYLLRKEAVEVNNAWYPKDEVVEIDGEWYLKEDCEEGENGAWVVTRERVPDHPDQIKLALEEVSK